MSKPIGQMTRGELIALFQDILEHNHQMTDPNCPWCGEVEFPVDEAGNPVDWNAEADSYHIDHEDKCAVTLIEAAFNGEYDWINEPGSIAQRTWPIGGE